MLLSALSHMPSCPPFSLCLPTPPGPGVHQRAGGSRQAAGRVQEAERAAGGAVLQRPRVAQAGGGVYIGAQRGSAAGRTMGTQDAARPPPVPAQRRCSATTPPNSAPICALLSRAVGERHRGLAGRGQENRVSGESGMNRESAAATPPVHHEDEARGGRPTARRLARPQPCNWVSLWAAAVVLHRLMQFAGASPPPRPCLQIIADADRSIAKKWGASLGGWGLGRCVGVLWTCMAFKPALLLLHTAILMQA